MKEHLFAFIFILCPAVYLGIKENEPYRKRRLEMHIEQSPDPQLIHKWEKMWKKPLVLYKNPLTEN